MISMNNKTIFDQKYKSMIESLKVLRKEKGITQRELATQLGVAHCYIGRVETCERRLDIMELIRILRIFKLSDKEILDFLKQLL